MRYFTFIFNEPDDARQEILIAELDAIGFEGFEQKEETLEAFISESDFSASLFSAKIKAINILFPVSYSKAFAVEKNWNEEWEKNFLPIVIANEVLVRASFHSPNQNIKHEIIIDPKMAFGTGHHATTTMMIELMMTEDFDKREVLDFGSGTGILSILASKLNCKTVLAIDNDLKAIDNAKENFILNNVSNATLSLNNSIDNNNRFDIVIANITRDILLANLDAISRILKLKGLLFLSGFILQDEMIMMMKANENALHLKTKRAIGDWLALVFEKEIF